MTCYALYQAGRSIHHGDSVTANRMFRNRIYAQAFTLLALVAGSMYYDKDRKKRKEFEGVIAERKAKEKNEAWIRELEARDKDDKEWKVRMGKVTAAEAKAAETEKEKKAGNEKLGGIVEAVKELTWGDRKPEQDGEGEVSEKQTASGSDKDWGIVAAVKNELSGTGKEVKDSGEDAVGAAKSHPASPKR